MPQSQILRTKRGIQQSLLAPPRPLRPVEPIEAKRPAARFGAQQRYSDSISTGHTLRTQA